MKSSKAALLIHYYFPPIHSIGSRRNFHFAEAWMQHCAEVLVLTTSNRNLLPADHSFDYSQIPVQSIVTNDYRTKANKLHSGKTHFSEKSKSGLLGRIAVKAVHTYPFNLWFGEGGRGYIKQAIEAGRSYLLKHPDAYIYSSFRPYADHAIAAQLRREFPKTTWIADFRDADVDPMYELYLNKTWQLRFNRKILSLADKVIAVSDGVASRLQAVYPNVVTVGSGVTVRKSEEKNPKFTICYTGSLYGSHRTPKPLFQALAQLIAESKLEKSAITVTYAGKDGGQFLRYAAAFELDSRVVNRGIISAEAAQQLQSQAHLNLLLTSAVPGYTGILTGKVYEYIGACTPILGLVSGIQDPELSTFFARYELGYLHFNAFDDLENMKNYLLKVYHDSLSGNVKATFNQDRIAKELSWEAQFLKIVE